MLCHNILGIYLKLGLFFGGNKDEFKRIKRNLS